MTLLVLGVALAGAGGAACRFLLDSAIRGGLRTGYPFGTLLINVSGSVVLGLLVGLASSGLLPPALQEVVGAGFLGGYTTFSTAAVEAAQLLRRRRIRAALLASVGMLVLATAAAAAGLALGIAVGTAL